VTGRDPRGGFILVAVLAVMALIAGLVAAVSLVVRASVASVDVEVDDLATESLVRAGIDIAAYVALVNAEPPEVLDGLLVRLDEGTVTLFALPTGGRIDLNTSPPELLEAAWRASRGKALRPAEFADRMQDWRDADQDPRERGAEAEDYASAGVAFRPADDGFQSVDDLRWVLGVTPADVERLRPLVGVLNPKGTINLFDASREVLEALPGMRRASVDRIVRLRERRTEEASQRLLQAVPSDIAEFVNADVKFDRVVRVRVEARPERSAGRSVEAVLIADPLGAQPYRVAEWREGEILRAP
jgi:general secretion pathway protein K